MARCIEGLQAEGEDARKRVEKWGRKKLVAVLPES